VRDNHGAGFDVTTGMNAAELAEFDRVNFDITSNPDDLLVLRAPATAELAIQAQAATRVAAFLIQGEMQPAGNVTPIRFGK
jgi:hypothetical protein